MSLTTTITCDTCGVTADAEVGMWGIASAPAWLTISGVAAMTTMDAFHEYRATLPDLCSWKCAAAYATQRAARETQPGS